MSIEQFLVVLRARWLVLLLSVLALSALVLAVSLYLPKKYIATATVVVDIKNNDPILGSSLTQATTSASYLATQVGVIKSDRVARRVINSLGLTSNIQLRDIWLRTTGGNGEFNEWLADYISKHVAVRTSREGSLIDISAEWTDGRTASALANAFAQAYIETNLALKVEPAKQYASWFAEQTTALRDNLQQAQMRLSEYQRAKGIIATEERLDVENARLNELSTQLVAVQGLKADSASRQSQGAANIETLPDVVQNPMISNLKADLARLQARREDASTRYGANHPDIQRMDSEIRSLREKVDEESQRVVSAVGASNRINTQREESIRSALDSQKSHVLALKKQRDEIAFLQADVSNAQRAYELVTQRLTQTSLESQSQTANVMIITPATAPLKPSSPRIAMNVVLALLLGTALGVAIALVLERIKPRIRSEEDLREALPVPMLARLRTA